jgi:acyl-[acyl-carrier-protein]-phospholipid O-acyltransferase/long-chain-fatty-acid--[acyl-carrier-protein] ligase
VARTQWQLFGTRRFLPLFITQFLGALNDNLFRQALVILITVKLAADMGIQPSILTNLAIGLFILPYFLFSALAGQLADKYEKTNQIVWIKIWEVGLMVAGAFAVYFQNFYMMVAVLSGLGLQSTFFGPIKYGVLPDLVKTEELLGANALIEAGTFVAILLGILVGGLVINQDGENFVISGLMIAFAVIGTLTGRMVPKTGQAAPDLAIRTNIFASTGTLLKSAWQNDIARPAIIGISWIWLYGSIYIAQIPEIVFARMGGDKTVITLVIACFSVGIGVGALLCSRILKGEISARLAPKALMGLGAVSLLFVLALPDAPEVAYTAETVVGIGAFVKTVGNWPMLVALIGVAMMAGMVIVPLYTILQEYTPREARSRAIAANNVFNSAFMAGGTLIAAALIAAGLTVIQILILYPVANLLLLHQATRLKARVEAAN